jgi:hypothetical protein
MHPCRGLAVYKTPHASRFWRANDSHLSRGLPALEADKAKYRTQEAVVSAAERVIVAAEYTFLYNARPNSLFDFPLCLACQNLNSINFKSVYAAILGRRLKIIK